MTCLVGGSKDDPRIPSLHHLCGGGRMKHPAARHAPELKMLLVPAVWQAHRGHRSLQRRAGICKLILLSLQLKTPTMSLNFETRLKSFNQQLWSLQNLSIKEKTQLCKENFSNFPAHSKTFQLTGLVVISRDIIRSCRPAFYLTLLSGAASYLGATTMTR